MFSDNLYEWRPTLTDQRPFTSFNSGISVAALSFQPERCRKQQILRKEPSPFVSFQTAQGESSIPGTPPMMWGYNLMPDNLLFHGSGGMHCCTSAQPLPDPSRSARSSLWCCTAPILTGCCTLPTFVRGWSGPLSSTCQNPLLIYPDTIYWLNKTRPQ